MRKSAFEQFSLWIVKIGLWTIPFLPLYVSSSMLFPFITGKNFAFRIIIEIIFAFWVGLAVLKEEYRPRLTPLFKVATALIVVLFLADFFSPNPYRAFFSNYERMEGFLMLFHLYLYFVMLASVFSKREWMVFFHMTIFASIAVSYVALLQKMGYRVSLQGGFRVDSTIGNPTYLAAYLLFHVWLLALFLYQWWGKWWRTAFYAAIMVFELAIIYFTATRGVTLALALILIPFVGAVVWFWPRIAAEVQFFGNRKGRNDLENQSGMGPYSGWSLGRKCALAFFIVSIALPFFFWSIRDSEFVLSRPALNRITKYSLQETTIKSRFLIWQMSAKAALERPFLGWGQENYYLVFQKYFEPGLFAQEPWFDRSHNVFFDWLINTGFSGLLLYLGLFGSAFFMMWRAVARGALRAWYGIVLSALFLSYFFQNIFVFDNLNTYLLFFAFLAYVHFSSASVPTPTVIPRSLENRREASGKAYAATALFLVAFSFGGYYLHVKPIQESKALIRALNFPSTHQTFTLSELTAAFEEALAFNTFGDSEVREQLSNFARGIAANESFPDGDRRAFLQFTIDELKKETVGPGRDVKHLLFLGALLSQKAFFDPTAAGEAEQVLKEAIRVSPTKQIIYFQLAQLYLSMGRGDEAIQVLRSAWDLDRNYHEAGANLLMLSLISGKSDLVAEVRSELLISALNAEVLTRVGQVYRQVGDYANALSVYKRLTEVNPTSFENRLIYAALLGQAGRGEEARRAAEEARAIAPDRGADVDRLLEALKQVP